MNRRHFLAIVTTATAGLFLPASGLISIPRTLALNAAGACSFCHKSAVECDVMAGSRGNSSRICGECIRFCLDILADRPQTRHREPTHPRHGHHRDWRRALADGGYSDADIDQLLIPAVGRPRRIRALECSFCDKSQRDVPKLIAGPNVYICDACVADGGTLLVWSGLPA